jgi:hypothetical protein
MIPMLASHFFIGPYVVDLLEDGKTEAKNRDFELIDLSD